MQGHNDIEESSQPGNRKRGSKTGHIVALALLTVVLSVAFGSEAPRQVFAASTACASTVDTTANGDTTSSATQRDRANKQAEEEGQGSCITDQYARYIESLITKVPRQPALNTEKPATPTPPAQQQKTPQELDPGAPVPTPTPTPAPVQPTPEPTQAPVATAPPVQTGGSVQTIIDEVFGSYAAAATQVATCESGLNPGAENVTAIGGSHAAGLFQILYPSTWNTTSEAGASPYDAYANAVAAHDIFVRDGYSWREWTCQP